MYLIKQQAGDINQIQVKLQYHNNIHWWTYYSLLCTKKQSSSKGLAYTIRFSLTPVQLQSTTTECEWEANKTGIIKTWISKQAFLMSF